ncbi:MAG: putative molybdopterin biosynthesis protein, partial [Pseudonocardiales bacterium]|nr:putative molybdopterin biosynthesis protein [Pseudonocardiales bacterium]
AGDLAPGAELSSVRDLARDRATTVATASRAYRHLAEHAVISLGSRRRARVSPHGPVAARRLLDNAATFRLAGSDDPALNLLLRHVGDAITVVAARGSLHGLAAVAQGDADGATAHLRHHSGVYNTPFARAVLHGRSPTLIHLWRREQGLLLPAGNPRGITHIAQVRDLRVGRRGHGTGTRVLLDQILTDAGVDPDDLHGPDLGSHLEVALAVAAGAVHTGLAVRAAAVDLDLNFLPVAWEDYDLVLPAAALGAAAPLVEALHDLAIRQAVIALGGYDLARAGTVDRLD